MDRRRRRILRAGMLGTLGALAGCLGGRDPGGSGRTPKRTGATGGEATTGRGGTTTGHATTAGSTTATDRVSSLGTTRTALGAQVTVTDVAVRDSVAALVYPDALGVLDADGGRYLLARVNVDNEVPDPEEFDLIADGGQYSGGVDFGFGVRGFDPYGSGARGRGWIAFEVPAPLEAETARVVVGEAAWRIPDRHVRRLRQPKPEYELLSFSVPDAVDPAEAIDAEATVRNTGDYPGTFRAVLTFRGGGFPCCVGPDPLVREIPAGERAILRASYGGRTHLDPGGDVRIRFKSPAGLPERTVAVNGSTTETTATTGTTTTESG